MTVFQAILIGLCHYVINSKYYILTQGQFVLGRPLVAGLVVGLIMGRPVEGVIIGANINLVYLGWTDVGGARSADPTVAGTLGTALALATNASVEEAVVLGPLLGVVANFGYTLWMSVNSIFVLFIIIYQNNKRVVDTIIDLQLFFLHNYNLLLCLNIFIKWFNAIYIVREFISCYITTRCIN